MRRFVAFAILAIVWSAPARAQVPGYSYLCKWTGLQCSAANGNIVSDTNPLPVKTTATASGGLSLFSEIVPNNTTSFVIKASPGQLYGLEGFSIAATTPVWLKIYDAAQGSTTCGSGTPKARYLIPASGGAPGSGLIPSSAIGDAYGTAITGCITAGIADNDTTAPAASSYTLNVHYK